MEKIENEFLKVSINPQGAVLNSIIFKETNDELLYQVEEGSWPFQDVQIFPLIGVGKFKYENKEFNLKMRHGFIRSTLLSVNKVDDSTLKLSTKFNENTLLEYPYKFEFSLTYQLIKNKLLVTSEIKNIDNKEIYFSYGSHTGIRAYSYNGLINFDKDYTFLPLISGLIEQNNKDNILMNCVNLKKDSFKKRDTFVFSGEKENLELYTGVKNITVNYEFDAPYFAIWSNPNKGDFVCVEPRWGISNYIEESEVLAKRVAINKLKENETKSFSYSLTFKNID